MIREDLFALKKDETNGSVSRSVTRLIPLLEAFPDHDMLPLVKDCLLSKLSNVHGVALRTYMNIEGAKAIPALREIFETENLAENTRTGLYRHFERVAGNLASKEQTEDAEKLKTFINEMRQADEKRKAKEKGED